jgi:hypothetical protein
MVARVAMDRARRFSANGLMLRRQRREESRTIVALGTENDISDFNVGEFHIDQNDDHLRKTIVVR